MHEPLSEAALAQAHAVLRADAVTAQAVRALEAAQVPVLLLKGPAIAQWLYRDGTYRPYVDSDLLVPAQLEASALSVLAALGFSDSKGGVPARELPLDHARTLVRHRPDGFTETVDLHVTLPQALGARDRAYEVLARGAQTLELGGVTVRTPGVPGLLVGLALHLAHDGAAAVKPREDLRRALALEPGEQWRRAWRVAEQLDALPAFLHGLRSVPEGADLAAGLGPAVAVPWMLRLPGPSENPLAHGFRRLAASHSVLGRLLVLAVEALPSARFLRLWQRERGRQPRPLAILYLLRWAYLAREGERYLRLWGRQAAARDSGRRGREATWL